MFIVIIYFVGTFLSLICGVIHFLLLFDCKST